MISYLEGKIIFKEEKFIILDVGGVGYKVFLSKKTLLKIPKIGESLKLFCLLDVRQNILDLYGFLSFEELKFFEFLDEIPSIGPKAALEISSIAPLEKIKEAIEKEDEKIIKEIFNIGKKKAQMIILELSRKIKKAIPKTKVLEDEAFQALINLGFSPQKVKWALSKIPKEIKNTEQKVKEALKVLGK